MKRTALALLALVMCLTGGSTFAQVEQSTTGKCSPAINRVGGNVVVTCIELSNAEERRELALSNIDQVIRYFQNVRLGNQVFFLPQVRRYINNPTPDRWQALQEHAKLTLEVVEAAARSALLYSDEPDGKLGPHIEELLKLASGRIILISKILEADNPLPTKETVELADQYEELIWRLMVQLNDIRSILAAS